MFNYVIWDFDGTLFDTYPAVADVFVKTLSSLGIKEDRKEILIYLHRSLGEAFDYFAKIHSLEADDIRRTFREYEKDLDVSKALPFPFASDMLQKVQDGGGMNLMYTNRGHSTFSFLKHHGYMEYFTEIITRDDGFGQKPEPDCILYFIEKYSLNKDAVLMVGDRELDVLSAGNAGIKSCYFNSHGIPIDTAADIYIDKLEDISQYI